jgi:hypothetical protein
VGTQPHPGDDEGSVAHVTSYAGLKKKKAVRVETQ